jgi:hypothetical protein
LASASLYIIEGQILAIRGVRASDDEMRSGELGVRPHSNKVGKNIKWRITKMRLKSIAVLVVAILLVAGSAGGIVVAGGGDRQEGEFRWDACYWWEAPPLTPYEREQVREIMTLVIRRYFGIDISAMSPEEFEKLGATMGDEKQEEIFRLFGQYAEKRGFEMPVGIPVPKKEFIPPADVRYWWELVAPEYREDEIVRAKKIIPEILRAYWQFAAERGLEVRPGIPRPEEVDVMRLTPEEYELVLNPPPPPLRLATIEEMKALPGVIAVYGRARTYDTQAEIREWLNELAGVCYPVGGLVDHMGVDPLGYISVGLDMDKLTINEAQALASQIYAAISERAERLGTQDVPVVFSLTKIRLVGSSHSSTPPAQPGYDARYRPIPGGVEIKGVRPCGVTTEIGTTGFAVRRPIAWWWDDIDYIVSGHLGLDTPTHIGMPIYQPSLPWRAHPAGTVEAVTTLRSLPGGLGAMADVDRVALDNWHVTPYIHVGGGARRAVTGFANPTISETIAMSGRASGKVTGTVLATGRRVDCPVFIQLFDQSIASFGVILSDSGAPIFREVAGGLEVRGVIWGNKWYLGRWRGVFAPISGVKSELPGWKPHTK